MPADDPAAPPASRDQRNALNLARYNALRGSNRLREVLLGEYRCRHGCLLLHAYVVRGRTMIYLAAYKLSPKANERTVAAARARRTSDGERRWNGRVLELDEMLTWDGVARADVNCDHHRGVLDPRDIRDDLSGARPGKPLRRAVP